jgi:hypothetical protein
MPSPPLARARTTAEASIFLLNKTDLLQKLLADLTLYRWWYW